MSYFDEVALATTAQGLAAAVRALRYCAVLAFAVMLIVSAALIVGAAWGTYGRLTQGLEGFIVALAGGALIISVVLELVEPATHQLPLWAVTGMVLVGAGVFTGLDWLVDERMGAGDGGGTGLLLAITLDGVPENLALGVALIGADPLSVAALSGSILLSNLPEAAGGARAMRDDGRSPGAVMGSWIATAALLSASALAGYLLLEDAPPEALALIRCFAGGAVVASLATEVFPTAYREEGHLTGIATALGLVLALLLDQL